MIRVVIYDDHLQPREMLSAMLSKSEGIICVGMFEDADHVLDDMNTCQPDVVLMDIEMPLVNGIQAVSMIKKHHPQIRVIMQTVFEDDAKIFASLQAGAEGYILKNNSAERIIQSIRDVYEGGASMTPSVAIRVMKFFNQIKSTPAFHLTEKEKEVLTLLSDGNSYKMVGARLNISYTTVNSHIKNIYEKLHVHSLGEAIAMAYKNKLV